MIFKNLLFVTKFEELCFDALRSLLDLREADLEHVVFLHVIEREKVSRHRRTGYQKKEEIRLREIANIRFIDWAENLFEQGLEVGVYITVGSVVAETISAATKESSDLIVIGRPHKGVLEQLYSGSDVTELLRRAAIPVLVYKHLKDGLPRLDRPFERPLLATDWSPASLKAVEYMKNLKGVIQEIDVAHVASEKDLKETDAMSIQKTRKEARRKLDAICEELEAAGIKANAHVYIGEPDEEIEKAAHECQSTLIVLGSSARSAWAERWLGSTPRKIAEKSVFPTLLIPPEVAQPE